MWHIQAIVLLIAGYTCSGQSEEMKELYFGGIFDELPQTEKSTTLTDEQAFNFALFFANKEFQEYGVQFKGLTKVTKVGEGGNQLRGPFKAKISTCSLISEEALVIFGPKNQEEIEIVQSICDYKDIAHVINRWIFDLTDYRSIINFYPHSSYLTSAYFSILKLSGWKSFTMFYEDNESLLRLGDLLNLAKNNDIFVAVRQLDEVGDGIYRTTLKQAVKSGERNYVIDCRIEILEEVLRQAQQVGLMTSHNSFFITNLDLHTIDLEPFQYSEANITGIRLFDPDSELVSLKKQAIIAAGFNPEFRVEHMRTETALLIDAVSVLAKVISTKLSFQEMEVGNVTCDSFKSSRHGYTIINNVKTSKNVEMTGLIEFDGNGFRSNFNLDVIEVVENGIVKAGTWNSSKGFVSSKPIPSVVDDDTESLKNRSFRVLTCLTDPYCMLKESSVQLFGNDRFEGFAIDLIKKLAEMEGFNYTFYIREDKSNGSKNKTTKEWSGMIRDLMDNNADLAIADLTINSEREEAVDFTSPFMNLGISILGKKPGNAPPSFFSFADPFALDTWCMLALAYAVVCFSFFIISRLSPDEWTNPYPCIEEPEYMINQFSLLNSFWFGAGSLMQQGTEIAPIGVSTRMVAGVWSFFVLIMVSSYTANLAAFLATENPIHLFTDVNSLVKNKETNNLRWGAKLEGATESFFKGKEDPVYKAIAEHMEANKDDMVKDNKIGVEKAENPNINYAFFMESLSIEYEIQRHCDLQQYGKLLDDKGYGIAMRKNSTYRKKLSMAILKLQGSGEMDNIKRTWWEEKRGGGACLGGGDDEGTLPLKVLNVVGVFYVTIVGTIIAIIIVIVEALIVTYKNSKKAKISFKEALKIEMHSYFEFNSNVKPTVSEKSKSGSKSSKGTGNSSNNNLMAPAPSYGFIPTITKEEMKD